MLDRFSINPTQLTGLLSFAAATVTCLIAARRSLYEPRLWYLLAFINSLFAFEIIFGLRHRIHDFTNSILIAHGQYAQREPAQEMIVIFFAIFGLMLVTLFLVGRQVAGRPARVAVSATIAVLALFAIETVSLHSLDAVFYRPIGPVLTIGWLWAIAAIGIILGSVSI